MLKPYSHDYFDLMEKNYKNRIDGIRFFAIVDLVKKSKPKIMLDAGCASGNYLLHFAKFANIIYGVDFSKIACEMAKKNTKKFNNIKIERMDLTKKLKFPDSFFDFILCSEVLEHIKDNEFTLSELKRVLKPNGLILITGPNFNLFSVEYLRYTFFYKDPSHFHNYSIHGWLKLLQKYFVPIEIITSTHYISIILFYLKMRKASFKIDKLIAKIPILNRFGRDVNILLMK